MVFIENIRFVLPKISLRVKDMLLDHENLPKTQNINEKLWLNCLFAKKGLRLFKGLSLLSFEKVYKAMFIQGATFIKEVRKVIILIKKYKKVWILTNQCYLE